MSISIILLFLNSRIENLARLGAAVSRYFLFLKKAHIYIFMIASKIFESGSAATVSEFNEHAERLIGETSSLVFLHASLAESGHTFVFLREADTSEIFNGFQQSIAEAQEDFVFVPTIDGHGGLFPKIDSKLIKAEHFARLPFHSWYKLGRRFVLIYICDVFYFLFVF